ncbi:ComEA family DNA-binding protein [Aerococcaceae bacterium zg-ZUI334]|uniref:helix-hairpin-helix domain-containing protein n=1 Tax=Aerococcaceae bacterium zg-252 TaxID=2796928 RepID=UPI001B9BCABE|nr:ComEA family DNA-binding protein [Aerococcaceae bacterium zg-ZUI334]
MWQKHKGVLVGVIVLLTGFIYHQIATPQTIDWQSEMSDTTQQVTEMESDISMVTLSDIYVDIKGAVKVPGVYRLTQGSRVMDVIEQAGGLLPEAADSQLNQAQLLTDQMMIYVPSYEDLTSDTLLSTQMLASLPNSETTDKININQADSTQLQTLPGIGKKKAEAIIQYRQENGSFQDIHDLTNVSGIGEKTFQQLQDYISVGP